MKNTDDTISGEKYYGKILTGKYSKKLKNRVNQYVQHLQKVEAVGLPALTYLAAWQDEEKSIWYEFACRGFLDMMGCSTGEIDGVFRNSVVDRWVYRYLDEEEGVEKDAITKWQISISRKKLREQSKKEGTIEAVYKILPEQGRSIWLKDVAKVEIYKPDKICLSLGCMTNISKEMAVAEEKERLAKKLQNALDELNK